MDEHGGCGIVFAILFIVAAVFAAGYLFAADNQVAYNAAEVEAARQAVAEANEAVLKAESALAESNAQALAANNALSAVTGELERLRQDYAALAGQTGRAAELEQRAAELEQRAAQFEAAVAASNEARLRAEEALDQEKALRIAAEQRAQGLPSVIPSTSAEGGKLSPASTILLGGIGLGGMAAGALITWAARPSAVDDKHAWVALEDGSVMVKLTREEARDLGRRRSGRIK